MPPSLNKLSHDESDELLEEAVRLHREIAKKHDLIIVEGFVPKQPEITLPQSLMRL